MTSKTSNFRKTSKFGKALRVSAALGLLLTAAGARADDTLSMAPPVDSSYSQETAGTQNSVFNWTEVPQNQRVPITRAVFDKGGYQLYDTRGETIVVPFANQNLYVMKFGQSTNGSMYFVNEGSVPVLYVPRNGYLENASASGARWYPFSHDYHPSEPVFLGIAPSWHEYVDMGWYPGMYCYGGYYSHSAFIEGSIFLPTIGLSIFIGGHPYYGWHEYRDYYYGHPAPYHVTIINNNYYRRDYHNDYRFGEGGGDQRGREFYGTGRPYSVNHTFGGGHPADNGRTFSGGNADHPYYAHRTFQGAGRPGDTVNSYHNNGAFGAGSHPFRGGADSGRGPEYSPGSGSAAGENHSFRGGGNGRGDSSAHGVSGRGNNASHGGGTHSSGGNSRGDGGFHGGDGGGGRR